MKLNQRLQSIFLSLAGHLLLFGLCGILIHSEQRNLPTEKIISSYVYSPKKLTTQHVKQTPIKTTKKALIKKTIIAGSFKKVLSMPLENEASHEKIHQQLLIILHKTIAAHESYPESALQLNQHGTVTLQFILQPDGAIAGAVIKTSSGFSAIDAAAMQALQMIAPVKEAVNYLKTPEAFSVDIVFQ